MLTIFATGPARFVSPGMLVPEYMKPTPEMPTQLSQITKSNLEKCQSAAIAAVESYNRPGPRFRTALYVVLIVMAWQAFFHAYYYKRKQKPWYQSRSSKSRKGVRYEKVDGDPKHWDLKKCLSEYFRDEQTPERTNLDFLLGLRNKIEHRNLPQLDPTLYGECQAALMNLEDYLVREFGKQYGLAESLALSLQFSRARPPEQKKAVETLAGSAKTVMDYIEQFRAGLTEYVLNDIGYSYRVFLVPKVANRPNVADAAIEFVHIDDVDDNQRERLKELNVLIKERHISVANLDKKKPLEVVKSVSAALPFVFKMHHHTAAWKHFRVRPTSDSNRPENTNQAYCVYDHAHKDYLYSGAWVKRLIRELSDPDKFRAITQRPPTEK